MPAPKKAKITILVGECLSPYYSIFEGHKEPLIYDDRKINATEEGLKGFYIVIGYTAYKRTINLDANLPLQADEITNAVWEMNREQVGKHIHTPWLQAIFNNKNPRVEGFIESVTRKNRKILVITENISIEIKYHKCVKGLHERKLNKEEITSFYFKYLPEKYRTMKIDVDVIRSGKRININNYGKKGVISFRDYISLLIKTNFPTNFLVFWVNTEKDVTKIYPGLRKIKKEFRCNLELCESGSRILEIPAEDKKIPVGNKSEGSEICLVMLKTGKFKNKDFIEIESRLQKFVKDEYFDVSYQVNDQDFEGFKLQKKKKEFRLPSEDMGLFEKIGNEQWREDLAWNFDGYAEKVYFFLIPKRNVV